MHQHPSPTTAFTARSVDVDQLGWLVEAHGVDAVPAPQLAGLARHARGLGFSPVLADLLLDPTQPAAARSRAFGRLALTVGSIVDLDITLAA